MASDFVQGFIWGIVLMLFVGFFAGIYRAYLKETIEAQVRHELECKCKKVKTQ